MVISTEMITSHSQYKWSIEREHERTQHFKIIQLFKNVKNAEQSLLND